MYVCTYVYIYIYLYLYMYIYIYMCVCVRVFVCIPVASANHEVCQCLNGIEKGSHWGHPEPEVP